jgi:hypothetical protein
VSQRLAMKIKHWRCWYAATARRLLKRLDKAIEKFGEEDIFINETNSGPDGRT